jgi:hypothetical protein
MRFETVLLDRTTFEPSPVGADKVFFSRFVDDDTLIGWRKREGGSDEREYVFFDLTTKTATPVPLPKEVSGEKVRVYSVLPSPDGKRLLFAWDEEVPPPDDWLLTGLPCSPGRMTIADRDGGNAKTIFKPEVKARLDQERSQANWIDWR